MKNAFTHWANLEAARDDSSMNYSSGSWERLFIAVTNHQLYLSVDIGLEIIPSSEQSSWDGGFIVRLPALFLVYALPRLFWTEP